MMQTPTQETLRTSVVTFRLPNRILHHLITQQQSNRPQQAAPVQPSPLFITVEMSAADALTPSSVRVWLTTPAQHPSLRRIRVR